MNKFFDSLTFPVLLAFLTLIWPMLQFAFQRRQTSHERQFEVYHRLVKELVQLENENGVIRIDRQAAVIFELRHFKRYYEFTERMLLGLKKKFEIIENLEKDNAARLIKEIELTLKYIRTHNWKRFVR